MKFRPSKHIILISLENKIPVNSNHTRLLELTRRAARGADRWTALQHGYAKPILRFASRFIEQLKQKEKPQCYQHRGVPRKLCRPDGRYNLLRHENYTTNLLHLHRCYFYTLFYKQEGKRCLYKQKLRPEKAERKQKDTTPLFMTLLLKNPYAVPSVKSAQKH